MAVPVAYRAPEPLRPPPLRQHEAARELLGQDLAIDLGTANTRIFRRGHGIVLNEPSLVAINTDTGGILAVGAAARQMIGRAPDRIRAVRPVQDGMIADFELTKRMLREFLRSVHRRRYRAPRVVLCVPSDLSRVERRAVFQAGLQAGARAVHLLAKPLAVAIGTGLAVHEAAGHMVVDIGAGTTEAAVICLGGIVTARQGRAAGDALDAAVIGYLRNKHGLLVSAQTAERVKRALGVGCAVAAADRRIEIRGRQMASGVFTTVRMPASEFSTVLEEPVQAIIEVVKATLETCPPELAADIRDRGVVLTGGGALLRGFDERLRHETGLPVHRVDQPLETVLLGAGRCLEDSQALRQLVEVQE